MGQKIPLEIEIAATTGGAEAGIRRVSDGLSQMARDAVARADQADAAIKGIGAGGIGSGLVESAVATQREINKVAAATDRLAARLENSIPFIGKTASETRILKAEFQALAAERLGMDDRATELRRVTEALREAEAAASGTSNAIVHAGVSAGSQRYAMIDLGQQIQDVGASFASGAPLLTIFAQQAGQVGYALSGMSGAAGAVGTFLSGPFGAALTLAGVLIGTLAFKSDGASDAHKRHAAAARDTADAIDQLNKLTGALNRTHEQEIGIQLAAARAEYAHTVAIREQTKARLEQAIAVARATDTTVGVGGVAGTSSMISGMAASKVRELSAALDDATKKADATSKSLATAFRGAVGDAIITRVQNSMDTAAAATQRYDDAIKRLNQEHAAGRLSDQQLAADVQHEINVRDAATKAADRHSDARRRNGDAARAQAAAEREAAAAAREAAQQDAALQQALGSLVARYDPAAKAARDYHDAIADISAVEKAGLIDHQTATDWAIKAGQAFADATAKLSTLQEEMKGWGVKLPDTKDIASSIEKSIDPALKLKAGIADVTKEATRLADVMEKAFGRSGGAAGRILDTLHAYGDAQKKIDEQTKAAGTNEGALAELRKQSGDLQLNTLVSLTEAGKSMFAQNSKGYQAMVAAEKVLTVVQLARTAVDVAGGAARMFATMGPLGFAAVGAMAAVMASFGFHGGGSSSYTPVTNTGTGTTLGDSTAKSDSIARSIAQLKDVDTLTATYSRDMLASLKSIDSQIGNLASIVVRTGTLDSATAGVQTGFQTSTLGKVVAHAVIDPTGLLSKIPVLGSLVDAISGVVQKLFGTKTKIVGSGIFANPQSLASILSGGFDGSTYADVQKTKKFLGLTTSKKVSTKYGELDDSVERQFGLILKSFDDAITAAAGPLGLATSDIAQKLDSFVVNIGKIDLTGLKGDEITQKLEAVFGAVGDSMAEAAIPGLERFQKVGEGYLETLTRVASTVEAVANSFDLLGQSASVAKLGIDGSMNIAGQFDSTSDFQSAIGSYFEKFYTEAEQTAAKTAQLGKVFASLGVAMPDSIAGFRQLVEAQDLSTAAGQQTYATLLKVAPAFADLQTSLGNAASAADILREKADLQRQLLEAQGDTAAIRAVDLAAIDESNRALQTEVWSLQDAKAAADAAAQAEQALAQTRAGLEDQILQLTGDTAAIRAKELAALDESLRPLQQRIYDLTDEKAASDAAAQAAQAAQQAEEALTQQRLGLEGQLLQLQGDTAEIRRRELAALDPSLRAIQQRIYDLTDEQAATQAAAQAAETAAQAEQALAATRSGLEDQILQLTGDTAAIRAKELASLDASLRPLQERIYALQDEQAATEAATQAAQAAAQAQKAIEDERKGLMQQLYEATNNTAALRAMQLDALDPSNRALQEQIFAIQDAKAAADAAKELADAWTSIGDTIMDEVKRIRGLTDAGGGNSFVALQGQFNAAVAAARAGDQAAAKGLPDLSKSLLDAAAAAATSRQELARIEAQTAAQLEGVYGVIQAATGASSAALAGFGSSGSSTPSDASAWWSTFAAAAGGTSANDDDAADEVRGLREDMAAMRRDLTDALAQLAGYQKKTSDTLDRAMRRSGTDALAVTAVAA